MATVLARRYQTGLATIRRHAASRVQAVWDGLPNYDAESVAPFVAQAVPIVGAAQRHAVQLTEAYMARAARGRIYGLLAGGGAATLLGAGVRNGVSPDDVYRRPFVNVWTDLKNGNPWIDAVAAGLARATATAQTDIALSTRAAAVEYARRDPGIVGWARVPDDSACDLCQLASEQTYGSEDLMPIHDRCGCTVEPITSEADVGDTSAPSGSIDDTSVTIQDHGELGPVLAKAGDAFTGPDDLS